MNIEEFKKRAYERQFQPNFVFDIGEETVLYFDHNIKEFKIVSSYNTPIVEPDLMLLALASSPAYIFTHALEPQLPRLPVIAAILDKIIRDIEDAKSKYTGDAREWADNFLALLRAAKALCTNPETAKGKRIAVTVAPSNGDTGPLDGFLGGKNEADNGEDARPLRGAT